MDYTDTDKIVAATLAAAEYTARHDGTLAALGLADLYRHFLTVVHPDPPIAEWTPGWVPGDPIRP